ncbi:MAG: serine/threonine-protein kinase, partial [Candidatus Nanoarchaeia archaeon]
MSDNEFETTINIPEFSSYLEKKIFCPICSNRIPWDKTLAIAPCPFCNAMLFYPRLVGKYLLYKPLGTGGVGHVFKAFRHDLPGRYVVKILPAEKRNDPIYREDILREARTGNIVGNHPNLVPVIEYGEEPETPYFIMPFIAGERLDFYIKRKKHLSEIRALNIVKQIIEAEMHIVSCGYLYRDLKLENILLEKNGNVRMFDYGLCIPKSEAVAKDFIPDEFAGSPLYIPPERIVGASEGEYSEIYS